MMLPLRPSSALYRLLWAFMMAGIFWTATQTASAGTLVGLYAVSPQTNEIWIAFNSPVDANFATNVAAYQLAPNRAIASARAIDPNWVQLQVSAPTLTLGRDYAVILRNLKGRDGSPLSPTNDVLIFPSQNYSGDVRALISLNAFYNFLPAGSIRERGFVAHLIQVADGFSNDNDLANDIISGDRLDPGTGSPYVNLANRPVFVETNIVNYNLDHADLELGSIVPDGPIPGIPGITGSTENIMAEFLTWVELKPGIHRLGVNSDDGFRLTQSVSVDDGLGEAIFLAEFDGTRAAADTTADLIVPREGLYAFRLLWESSRFGAAVEWWEEDLATGARRAINAPDGPPAYCLSPAPPVLSVRVSAGNRLTFSWPIASSFFWLETSTSPAGPWITRSEEAAPAGDRYALTLNPTVGAAQFFRLRR